MPRKTLEAQAAVLDELIQQSRDELPTLDEVESQLAKLIAGIDRLELESSQVAESVDRIRSRADELRAREVASASRLLVVEELLERFALLEQSYRSDLSRLGLISDGGDLLSQMPLVRCPICGQELGDEIEHGHDFPEPDFQAIREGAAEEARKVSVLLLDLQSTAGSLRDERTELRETLSSLRSELERESGILGRRLEPRFGKLADNLRGAYTARQSLAEKRTALLQRATLIERRHEPMRQLDKGDCAPRFDPVERSVYATLVGV